MPPGAVFVTGTSRADHGGRRAADALTRTSETWDLSRAEAARLFRVSREEIGQWRRRGVLREHAGAVSDLSEATDLLVLYLKRNRIPAVVRRSIPALDGASLVDLLGWGDTGAVLAACRDMFRFDQVGGNWHTELLHEAAPHGHKAMPAVSVPLGNAICPQDVQGRRS